MKADQISRVSAHTRKTYMKNGRVVILDAAAGKERVVEINGRVVRSIDVSGQQFSDITAMSTVSAFDGDPIWKCMCRCGRIVDIFLSTIFTESRLSCAGPGRLCHSRYKRIQRPLRNDLTGQVFGRLTVKRVLGSIKGGIFYECICECGRYKDTVASSLVRGFTTSCGCFASEVISRVQKGNLNTKTHGMRHSSTYNSWRAMLERCENKSSIGYSRYGGRGITVCNRWKKFENFLEDMGERPEGKTLDRKNVDGNYEPSNCVWSTFSEQSRNKTNNHFIEHGGERLIVADWAKRLGVTKSAIFDRIRRGWTDEEAVSTPFQSKT